MINLLKEEIKSYLENLYDNKVSITVEEPKDSKLGDISVPVFSIVKTLRQPLPKVVEEVKTSLKEHFTNIKEISNVGGFINIVIDKDELSFKILEKVITEDSNYGSNNLGNGDMVVLDYSSPNIAKSFSIGHLRSTIIGNSLKLIYQKCGYKTFAINYLGDWGTQFGKMIVAYKKWGNKEEISKDPINEMTKLYVKFHEEAKLDPSLEDEAREAFRKCELGEKEYLDLWAYIREESLKESAQIYDLLEVDFDSYNGEAFYNDKMDGIVNELTEKNLLVKDDGALIVPLGDDMPPALIKRSDGGSLYITRDLAALFYRKNEYNFKKILYVVGNEQKLHFKQIKMVVDKLGYDFSDEIYHVGFGLYLTNGKKMSTRSGGVVKLYDVLQKAINMAYNQIEEKNKDLPNKEDIARKVGIAAVMFGDLKNHRELDIEFDLENCVKFEGQTGPYLQYSGVRIASILKGKTFDINNCDKTLFEKPHYFELIKLISNFSQILEKSCNENTPSTLAKYLLNLAQSFNKFYSIEKINVEDEKVRNTNFALIKAIRIILNEGLRLLGIHYLDEM